VKERAGESMDPGPTEERKYGRMEPHGSNVGRASAFVKEGG
jgi:hypothetical protein